jgi:hypothetical protein
MIDISYEALYAKSMLDTSYSINSHAEHGQVLLIIVLVMVVAMTIGLSLASRSIIHIKTTTDEQDSQKAFSAAEAGVEQALQTNTQVTSTQPLGNNAAITDVSIDPYGNSKSLLMNNGQVVHQDDGGDVWLTTYDDNPSSIAPGSIPDLTVYWGNPTYSCTSATDKAAIEVMILTESGAGATPQISHYAFDPCSRGNNFDTSSLVPGVTISGQTFKQGATISGITGGIYARIVPLYSDAVIGVSSSKTLPQQGKVITSTGTSGATQRTISYFQAYASVPTEFFYTLFSTQ